MTIRSDATRLVAKSSSSVFSDSGLAALCRDLKDIYDECPEEDVVDDVRSHLQQTYGVQNVQEQVEEEEWIWVWDPVSETWKRIKKTGSIFTIDDGGTYSLLATVFILVDVT